MNKLLIVVFILFTIVTPALADIDPNPETGFSNLKISPNGDKILYNIDDKPGLYIASLTDGKSIQIASGIGCAYRASWSADSRFVGFKLLQKYANHFLQTPALYDVSEENIILLSAPSLRAGIPSISLNNRVAFTIGKTLYITDCKGAIEKSFALPVYANQTPLSPDGKFVIYNDQNDALWLLEVLSGERKLISSDENGFFEPIWSPDSRQCVFSGLAGILLIYDIDSEEITELGPGRHPTWSADGEWLLFSQAEIIENRELKNIELYIVRKDGADLQQITSTEAWEDFPTFLPDGKGIFYADRKSGELALATTNISNGALQIQQHQKVQIDYESVKHIDSPTQSIQKSAETLSSYYFDIPYVHQRYDTPDWFNGNSACGATSATMCLTYYDLLVKWPISVSWPSPHTSDYGNYICSIYTYNGYKFNIWAYDPNNTKGYGGFGFIVRNGSQAWSDTKGYMAEYAKKHGLNSYVDWNPSRAKLIRETDAKMPFVLLNSLTSSGHYISVIGYESDATTVIVNDPYGNKNDGYCNFDGKQVYYDWPGYSNGYSNLNTVWCYIYFRGACPDLMVENTTKKDTSEVSQLVILSADVINIGDTTSTQTTADIVLSKNSYYDAEDWILKTISLPELTKTDTFSISEECFLPDSVTSGLYNLGIYVDVNDLNIEVSEGNNFSYSKLSVCGYPSIYRTSPYGNITDPLPTIKGYFHDAMVEIDSSSIKLFVDQIDVTPSSVITSINITYSPETELSEGEHEVIIKVSNELGYTSTKKWYFSVEPQTSVEPITTEIPSAFELAQNYPNPFNSSTKITFMLPTAENVSLNIYNINGELIKKLVESRLQPGSYSFVWNGKSGSGVNLASGLYFLYLKAGAYRKTMRMLLLK